MASTLKSFSAENEKFSYEDIKEFPGIGLEQDETTKYVFLLQNNHRKEITDMEKSESDFNQSKKDRIINSLKGVKQFLKDSVLYDFFVEQKPLVISLYFIRFYFFYKKSVKTEDVTDYFRDVEKSIDYKLIYRRIYLSLLQKFLEVEVQIDRPKL